MWVEQSDPKAADFEMGQQHRKHRLVVPLLCTLGTLQMMTWICAQDLDSPEYISSLGAERSSPLTT